MAKRCWIFVIIVLISFSSTGLVCAQVTATLSAEPASYSGPCPADISFKGTIKADKPGKVQYQFVRSDGTLFPVETLDFKTPGTKEVNDTWTTGSPVISAYKGWQQIKIVYPEELESNQANFKIACDQTKTDLAIKIKKCPKVAKPGHEIGSSLKITAINNGAVDLKDVGVDITIRKDAACPVPSAPAEYTPHFSNGGLLKGGHEVMSLSAGHKHAVKLSGPNTVPADTPPGDYFICAVIDPENRITESNKGNNCTCCPIKIAMKVDKPDLVIEKFSFKGWGKCEPNNPIFTFEVTVANVGTAPSPAMPNKMLLNVMDQNSKWGNGTGLNAIPPGGRQTVLIPVYYFDKDPAHMTKVVPHPFRAVVDPLHLIDELTMKNKRSDIIYLDPRSICGKDNK